MTCTVSAVVVAFSGETALEECLHSLDVALARVPETELIVVLNGASARVRSDLRALRPAARLLEPRENLGFAGGVTAALAEARGEWIALVNDDCVLEPGALAELLAVGRSGDDVGSVAAQVRFSRDPETINSAGLELDALAVARERLLGSSIDSVALAPAEVFGATGTLGLYRRAMLDAVGGFDDSFFAYLEDADLAWRAQMFGWRCLYAPRAVAFHDHSASLGHASREKHLLVGRNRVRMIAKNATAAHLRRYILAMLAYDFAHVVFATVQSRSLAPLIGRWRGLREWRAYRAAGRSYRRAVSLEPPSGIRAALRRNRVYEAVSPRSLHHQ